MHDALDIARATELYDTIPRGYFDIAVTTSAVTHDLNRLQISPGVFLSLSGKRVRFRAITQNVTFLAATEPTLAAGAGIVLASGADSQRYFIPPAQVESSASPLVIAIPLTVISSGAATLRVFYGD